MCGMLDRQLACAQAREPEVEGGNSNPSVCVSECLQAGAYLVHICKFTDSVKTLQGTCCMQSQPHTRNQCPTQH